MAKQQTELDGFQRDSIEELDDLVRAWLKAKGRQLDAKEIEKHAHDACQEMMMEYKLDAYLYVDGELAQRIDRVKPPEKLSAKKVPKPEEVAF